jgi:hypothetical protein
MQSTGLRSRSRSCASGYSSDPPGEIISLPAQAGSVCRWGRNSDLASLTPRVPEAASRPLKAALEAFAFACIIFAFLLIASVQIANPEMSLGAPLFLLFPYAFLLRSLHRAGALASAWVLLLSGGIIQGLWSAVLMSASDLADTTDASPHTLLKVALLLAGGPSRSLAGTVSWSLAGYVAGEAAVRGAAWYAGGIVEPDYTSLIVLISVVGARVLTVLLGRPSANVHATLRHAARKEELAMARARAELNASALLHDTVLRDLSNLRSAGAGPLDDRLGRRLDIDLGLLAGGAWETAGSPTLDRSHTASSDDFDSVLASARENGLRVDVTGDYNSITALDEGRRLALALAMHQCLVNVSEHAGVDRADVTLARTATMVSVMVVDAGRGFRIEDTAPDRLGLRQSVIRRMTEVGGNARVWSVPGAGTTVQLLAPIASTP